MHDYCAGVLVWVGAPNLAYAMDGWTKLRHATIGFKRNPASNANARRVELASGFEHGKGDTVCHAWVRFES
jgi:hypothetical protein